MNNELITEQSWWKSNRKWFLPTLIITFLLLTGLLVSSGMEGNITDIAKAYSEDSLYERAIDKANTNKRVLELIGKIEPIDQLAILEGNAVYANNHTSVELSVRVKGNKGKGKMDISARKNGNNWEYKYIKIRIKEPKEEIHILPF
jgi:hypothetical protein